MKDLEKAVAAFVAERDWDGFHTPKNLLMALSVEVAELMEPFRWLTPEESSRLPPSGCGRPRTPRAGSASRRRPRTP